MVGGCEAGGALSSSATRLSSSSPPIRLLNVPKYLSSLPACGAACVNASITAQKCADVTSCICSPDHVFKDQTQRCLESSCSLSEQFIAKNTTEAACGRPPRDKSRKYDATSISLCVVTGILVVMRVIFKQWFSYQKQLSLDDWVIILSAAVGLPCTILNTAGLTANGLGKDAWTLRSSDLVEFGRYFFVQQILYLVLMTFIKVSLLCFYLSIFPNRRVRLLLWLTVAANLAWGFVCIVITIFQCSPVQNYWLRYLQQEGTGKCLNMNLLGWGNGAVSVAIDIWIIGIPMYQMRKLDLGWRKKIGAVVMFLTGAFVTIVSILRLQSLAYFYSSSNPTWDLWYTAWWSTIEINVGLMCACLPTVRVILVRLWPDVFGSTIYSRSSIFGSTLRSSSNHGLVAQQQAMRYQSSEVRLVKTPTRIKEEDCESQSSKAAPRPQAGQLAPPPKSARKGLHKSLPPLPPMEKR
ncbi:hypothetical protein E4U42_007272 [Claviceps africana]|uniref:CFEM domain-containing protein n=1 Tax=Claviceps africana TaxID=83212 RepID=A0A8K0J439_9HYPO|nr:hypothetical protein E4U42_007272 [Claviceps africana]